MAVSLFVPPVLSQGNESGYTAVRSVNIGQGSYFATEPYFSSAEDINGHPAAYNQLGSAINSDQRNMQFFVQQLCAELLPNLAGIVKGAPVAVASFVMLDGDLMKTNLFGQQLSENFIHELYKAGIAVIDFKVTDYLRVAPSGDYILSRDYLELGNDIATQFILAGTLVKHRTGYLVNARVVGVKSKLVVASAHGLIPNYVTAGLVSSDFRDGVRVR